MRRIGAVTIGQPVEDDDLSDAAAALAGVADRLEEAAARLKRRRNTPGPNGFPGVHPQDHFPTSPMIGFANPISPPVEVWAVHGEDGQRELRGRVTFDYPYEGPPTCVHGGVIAELFDELLGLSNILAGLGAMTGTLTIRYRRPTPLLAPLELAARHTGSERPQGLCLGRPVPRRRAHGRSRGDLHSGGAEADARHRDRQRPRRPQCGGSARRRGLAAHDGKGGEEGRRVRLTPAGFPRPDADVQGECTVSRRRTRPGRPGRDGWIFARRPVGTTLLATTATALPWARTRPSSRPR